MNGYRDVDGTAARFPTPPSIRKYQLGFILSIEAILVITILGIGLLVGIGAVRNAMLVRNAYRDHTRFLVVDSSGVFIGEAVGFDEYDTPLVPFVDYSSGGNAYRTLIGIRPNRFTSRQPVFYKETGCPSAPAPESVCLAPPGSAGAAAILSAAGLQPAASYLSGLQGEAVPLYAVGAGSIADASGGVLYRSTTTDCDGNLLQSVWYSGAPGSERESLCFDFAPFPADPTFRVAEPVLTPGGVNVLEELQEPFRVNLVVNPAAIEMTAPCQEGGACAPE